VTHASVSTPKLRLNILPLDALSANRTLEGDIFCPLLEHNHRIVEENADRHSGEGLVACGPTSSQLSKIDNTN
jgi:hypothetical protein